MCLSVCGRLWGWGKTDKGQLGSICLQKMKEPVEIKLTEDESRSEEVQRFTSVTCGSQHACAINGKHLSCGGQRYHESVLNRFHGHR